MKITHLTTVHPRNDVRVLHKQCVSLAEAGIETKLLVADGLGNEVHKGVQIIDIGDYRNSRLKRLTAGRNVMLKFALQNDSDIYQIHDPELLKIGIALKKRGKKVVFDSHEDVPKQILYKAWLGPLFIRKILSKLYNSYEKRTVKRLDGLISVIDEITDKFECSQTATLKNYPIISLYKQYKQSPEEKNKQIVYVGSITKERGIYDCIQAMKYLPDAYTFVLIGKFQSEKFKEECESLTEWSRVKYLGFKSMEEVAPIIGESFLGLSVLHPEENYLTSLPTKGFEYLAAGTPVIMSDFEYWAPYFKGCGELIEPQQPKLIADAIIRLIHDKKRYLQMQENGLKQAKIFSWESEAKKMIEFINKL